MTDINDIKRSYIRLGFHLVEFERLKYYRDFGYSSLAEFSDKNLGLDKSALSRCMAVFKAFADRTDRNVLFMKIKDKYADYSYSQLCEMLTLDAKFHSQITPDMSIKQIREFKKSLKNKADIVDVTVATSQLEETEIDSFDSPLFLDRLHLVLTQCINDTGLSWQDKKIAGKMFRFSDMDGNTYCITFSKYNKGK